VKKSLERLKPVDRELNQLKTLSKLVERGIGVHHAGLLPIAKEIVEILFADGYLSVVFATKTLAIGINMPARSVMFLNVIEFYGSRKAMSASEYLQMAGRAGRRGKDTEGLAMIFLDPAYTRPPKKEEVREILVS
jgi:antiviral helicase SKI2